MIVVIDTNVLVSALLNPAGISAKTLKMLLNGRFVAAVQDN
jgi:predicted nucleic acid-binding protein